MSLSLLFYRGGGYQVTVPGPQGYVPRRAPWQVFAGSEAQGGGAAGAQPPGVGPGGFVAVRGAVLLQAALAAVAIDQTAATAGLSTGIALGGTAAAQTVASGSLGTDFRLGAFAGCQAAASGAITAAILLSAAASGKASTDAVLGTGFQLLAFAGVQASATPALSSGVALAVAASGNVVAATTLSSGIPIAASGYGVGSASGAMSRLGALFTAQAAGIVSTSATLTTGEALIAAAYGSANVDALLAAGAGIAFGASVYGVGVAGADLTVAIAGSAFAANVFGVAFVAADLGHAALAVFPFEPRRFDVKSPGEVVLLRFDFAPDLLSTESLSGIPSIAFRTSLGKDLNPLALAGGAAWIDGSQVIVPVQGGLDGREYDVEVVIATTDPLKVLTLIGTLPIRTKS